MRGAPASWSERAKSARRATRLLAMAVALILIIGASGYTWWNQEPTEQELRQQAGLVGKRVLTIGTIGDMPGLSFNDDGKTDFSGFDIDIAYLVASYLGFRREEVEFYVIRNEDRVNMRAQDNRKQWITVDLVVASLSINDEREAMELVTFSAPYLFTELAVVTKVQAEQIESLRDLQGQRVCTLGTSTAEGPLAKAGVQPDWFNRISNCKDKLLAGEYDAMVTDAAILAGFVADPQNGLMFHDISEIGEERWGINTGKNVALRDLVNLALCRSRNDPHDTAWEDAFARSFRLPGEAQDIAVGEQPEVPKIEIRALPGELPDGCH